MCDYDVTIILHLLGVLKKKRKQVLEYTTTEIQNTESAIDVKKLKMDINKVKHKLDSLLENVFETVSQSPAM